MKLGDFQIYRREHGVWDVHVDFQHHKVGRIIVVTTWLTLGQGWNTSITGFSQTHVYRALKHVHNLMYDPVWIVAYMFVRKAFKYEVSAFSAGVISSEASRHWTSSLTVRITNLRSLNRTSLCEWFTVVLTLG